jgi:murein DD-endopeptidase MepM/ murein hydrolase activator NlpD
VIAVQGKNAWSKLAQRQLNGKLYQILFYLGLAVVTGRAQAASDYYCYARWACLEKIQTDNSIEFWLINQLPYPISLTLTVSGQNLAQSAKTDSRLTVSSLHSGAFSVNAVLANAQRVLGMRVVRQNQKLSMAAQENLEWTPGDMHAQHNSHYRYQYPYAKNQYFPIVQGFGGGYSHQGASRYAVDFAMPVGTPVYAARNGVVIDLIEHHNKGGSSRRFAKYANFVSVLHDDGTTGEYYHLRKNGVVVERGQGVAAGDLLGYSGNTGFSSLSHLHFAVYKAKAHGEFESLPFNFVSTNEFGLD